MFVFGSNLSGIHGAGAARAAHQHYGAKWGVADGMTGQCYAIPTVREHIAGPLTVDQIKPAVERFIAHAQRNPETQFFVTRIGCGLAAHRDQDIAPLFAAAPLNCSLPETWAAILQGESL